VNRTPALAALLGLAVLAGACGLGDDDVAVRDDGPVTLTLVTHDSFDASEEVLDSFTEVTGIELELLSAGDAGSLVNQAILTKGAPQGDVLFGVDSTFLSRALDADVFLPYESPAVEGIDEELLLDPEHRVTPIDTGDVCLNYDVQGLADAGLEPPVRITDLTDPAYEGTLVVEDPSTSSPGLAFLLATIAEAGEDGWQDLWRALRANDVAVASGWEEAYYTSFSGAAGSPGDRPIVVSYASSPPAEVVFSEEPVDEAPTAVVEASCYRQIEFAGILAGTDKEEEARKLIDFLLSPAFQEDIPLRMFVYPVVDVPLPAEFVEYGPRPDDPYLLDPDLVAERRDEWIEEWSEIVLR